jgi:putative endonuclease
MSFRNRKIYFVYILGSDRGVLYTGVTNDLERRVWQHKQGQQEGFTSRYKIHRLLHYEEFEYVYDAIEREKQIKCWRREKKLALIREFNETFADLSEGWFSQEGG